MGLKLIKKSSKSRRLAYYPIPREAPDVVLYYVRLPERETKIMREKFGKQFLNKTTGKMDFEVIDEEGFKQFLLDNILVGWGGFYYDEEDLSPGETPELIPFSEVKDYYDSFPPWMMHELTLRALGLSEAADTENLLCSEKVEEESKNS